MMKKKLVILVLAFVVLFSMSGCIVDIDGRYKGFSSGFNYQWSGDTPIVCAARSDKTNFDINEVTLDFYFGWIHEPYGPDNRPITFALYVANGEAYQSTIRNIDDYKNLEGHVFLKEIATSEFASDEYYVSMTQSKGKVYKQSERYTISKALFSLKSGNFYFCGRMIGFSNEDNQFYTSTGEYIKIGYEYIDESTVRLSKIPF